MNRNKKIDNLIKEFWEMIPDILDNKICDNTKIIMLQYFIKQLKDLKNE